MAVYSIYGLVDPTNGELFYIGQTIMRASYRVIGHICASKSLIYPVHSRLRDIMAHGLRPKLIFFKETCSELADISDRTCRLSIEKMYIENFSDLGTLLNITHNPLYDKKTKTFSQPKNKKQLIIKKGKYYVELPVHPYNPYDNPIWKRKMGLSI